MSRGADVVVVLSLREATFYDRSYQLGFPLPGHWREIHNGDRYDKFPNPWRKGTMREWSRTDRRSTTSPIPPGITIPANSLLVFAHE